MKPRAKSDVRTKQESLTLLKLAAEEKTEDFIKLITAAEQTMTVIDYTLSDSKGRNTLTLAILTRNEKLSLFILSMLPTQNKENTVNQQDENGETPLHYACALGLPTVTKVLIQAGANTKIKNVKKREAIDYTECDDQAVATILRSCGIQPSRIDTQAGLSFLRVARRDQQLARDLLIEAGVSYAWLLRFYASNADKKITTLLALSTIRKYINQKGKPSEKTALHLAAEKGFDDICEQLLQAGADINAYDAERNTPYLSAFANNKIDTLCVLLKHNPRLFLANKANKNLFTLIADRGNFELATRVVSKIIETKITSGEMNQDTARIALATSKFLMAVRMRDYAQCTLSLAEDADINSKFGMYAQDSHDACSYCGPNDTPLTHALKTCDVTLAEFLLENKANVELSYIGEKALMTAAFKHNALMVALLIKYGADVNSVTPDNKTAMTAVFLSLREWILNVQVPEAKVITNLLRKAGFFGQPHQVANELKRRAYEKPILDAFADIWMDAYQETEDAYTKGAVAGAFGEHMPAELGQRIGFFLTRKDGGSLAQVSKTAAASAISERERVNRLGMPVLNRD